MKLKISSIMLISIYTFIAWVLTEPCDTCQFIIEEDKLKILLHLIFVPCVSLHCRRRSRKLREQCTSRSICFKEGLLVCLYDVVCIHNLGRLLSSQG